MREAVYNKFIHKNAGGDTMSEPLLSIKGACKRFAGVKALDNVCFDVNAGEVHVLMGENGAGKSTLMRVIDGIYRLDAGEIWLNGQKVSIHSPREAQLMGVSMIHQELSNVLEMTVAENIFLGREPKKFGLLNRAQMNQDALKALERVHLDIPPATKMKNLSVAQMQMVEIAKAISYNARIIIMDEPTSAISDKEIEALFSIIEMLRSQGVGIVYISHRMNEVFRIADRITVLRDGVSVGTFKASQLDSESLIALMVGRKLVNLYPPARTHDIGEVVLSVEHLSSPPNLKDASFTLRAGEILGIGGLMGAGRSELLETLFGIRPCQGGEIRAFGKKVKIDSPSAAIQSGIAFVTEDRKRSGLNLKTTVRNDISIVTLKNYCALGQFIRPEQENAAVDRSIELLHIKTPSRSQKVVNLSGGNQQKVILARWLLGEPGIILMDEPTRGIDVGAKYEIYCIIKQLAQSGKAIVMVSSEMPEIIGMCDRVIIMHEGRITGELAGEKMNPNDMMKLAAGLEV